MNANDKLDVNEVAYQQLKETIEATYPKGRFVAIHEGRIVADAATFEEIDRRLNQMGIPNPEGMVVQVGLDYPENGIILPLE